MAISGSSITSAPCRRSNVASMPRSAGRVTTIVRPASGSSSAIVSRPRRARLRASAAAASTSVGAPTTGDLAPGDRAAVAGEEHAQRASRRSRRRPATSSPSRARRGTPARPPPGDGSRRRRSRPRWPRSRVVDRGARRPRHPARPRAPSRPGRAPRRSVRSSPSTSSAASAITIAPPGGHLRRGVSGCCRAARRTRGRAARGELRPATHRSGRDGRPVGQIGQRGADQHVARIVAGRTTPRRAAQASASTAGPWRSARRCRRARRAPPAAPP